MRLPKGEAGRQIGRTPASEIVLTLPIALPLAYGAARILAQGYLTEAESQIIKLRDNHG